MAAHTITVSVNNKRKEESSGLEEPKLTDWKLEPRVSDLMEDFRASKQSHDTMVTKINEWVNQLQVTGSAKPRVFGKNRSTVQPKLIRKQGEWRYSALTESFLSAEKLFDVEPRTWEDDEAAKQNEILINWQFNNKINKVAFIDEYIRTCYDEGTVFVKTGWYRRTHTEKVMEPVYNYVEITTQEQLDALQQALELRKENPRGYNENVDPAIKAAIEFFEETGQPCVAVPTGEEIEVEKEVIDENTPTLEILDYNNVYFDPSCQGDLDKANFALITFETSKAELQADGRYKNLDKVNFEGNTPLSVPDHQTSTPNDFNFKDQARKRVVAYEYWGFYDIKGDGVLVPIVATWIGNTMIRMEENPFPDKKIPIVAVPYMPIKKSVYGEADAELLKDNQAIIGAVTRGLIDSLGRTANGQRGFAKNMLDIANRRKFENGEDYEFNPGTDPRQGIVEHKFGEVSQSALAIVEMQNQEAESLTGVKAFTGGLSGESYGKVAAGIRGMLDAASKREMGILRRLAQGMVMIGKKIIAMNAVFMSEEEVIRVSNSQYIPIRREDLKGNFDLIVDISTPEVDEAKAQDLAFMIQTNGNNMDAEMRNMIFAEIAELKRQPKLAHKLRTFKPTPDPLTEKLKQLEIQKLELENQKTMMEIQKLQTDAILNQAKAREVSSSADLKDLDFVEQETGTKHVRELEKQREQAKGNQNLKITEAILKPKKAGESPGSIEAAIGFNRLSEALSNPLIG